MIPLVDLWSEYQSLKSLLLDSVQQIMESGSFILGEKGKELEKTIAQYLGTTHSLGVANGTDALLLSLEALGIGVGDEVITTPFTFVATAEVIARAGATPVFVDIDPLTYNIDPNKIEQAITPRTKAMIVVHLFGQPADLEPIKLLTDHYNLLLIEDACQSIGATYKERKTGSIGELGCFSFFPTKNLGAYGDGGMIVTNNSNLYDKICCLRNHGSIQKYVHTHIGVNSRLDEIQAAILSVKFQKLEEWNQKRRDIAGFYTEHLADIVKTPYIAPNREHVFHQYCIESQVREKLVSYLNNRKIATGIYYPIPLHLQPVFRYLGYKEGSLPISERASQNILALPIFPMLTKQQQEYIITSIREFVGGRR